jgi:hypothetical protein
MSGILIVLADALQELRIRYERLVHLIDTGLVNTLGSSNLIS